MSTVVPFAALAALNQWADPFVGGDIEGCRDPKTGAIHPLALAIVRAFNTYTEISPSGTGLKLWECGTIVKAISKSYLRRSPRRSAWRCGLHGEGAPWRGVGAATDRRCGRLRSYRGGLGAKRQRCRMRCRQAWRARWHHGCMQCAAWQL
jgi:hypothetical protein